jgi:RNA polymerase sigma factor (sigma-70 family)
MKPQREPGCIPDMRTRDDDIGASVAREIFARERPALVSLAYRMLGSRAEAEDAVQDTYLKWQEARRSDIHNPAAWLTTACTRRCIDLLRSARRLRVDYVGAWLPEAVHTVPHPEDEQAMSLAGSLSTAFLLMLERLSPRERAAYLLHDIFELPYGRVAEILGVKEAACRKLVSRAREGIGQSRARFDVPPLARQEELLAAFQDAIVSGNATRFAEMLSDDIEIRHDSGGKVSAAIHVLEGKARVRAFIEQFLHRVWKRYRWVVTDLNGARGVLLEKDAAVVTAIAIGFDDRAQAAHIYILRNPDKLASLGGGALDAVRGRVK